ncbi:hypothetical protein ACFSKU_17920 [Pontibacter silvestris]|uniref:Uncharacterized protein n=1 Tax=Pontibacter silvestris TaxID=2305183 RepID=A0ABW4X2P1_9BACT|nr:hypothetical protein [Pontibacter silvestris]MCC9135904.1 hypothetical protein [Pontibacter silvestris]
MLKCRSFLLPLFCLVLLLGAESCQRKGIPCPKPTGKRNRVSMKDQAGHGFEAIKVPTDKNGRVKKRKKLLF